MTHVILINPPSPANQVANREGTAGMGVVGAQGTDFVYPPQTMATVAAVLRDQGYEVSCVDAVAERLDTAATIERVLATGEHVDVGVFVSQATRRSDMEFIDALAAAQPGGEIIAFGPAMRFIGPDIMANSNVTAVAMGEPETAVLSTLQMAALESEESDEAWVAGPAAVDADPNTLPYPAWDLLPHALYPFLTLRAGRGCDDNCAYCPYVASEGYGRTVRTPAAVADELAWLARTYPKPRYLFRDIVFAADRAWVEAFCRVVVERKLEVAWECESRPEHFDLGLLRNMARAGCTTIKIGVETLDDDLLESMGRLRSGESADDYRRRVQEVLHAADQVGIGCRVFVMLGLPGETDRARTQTREFLARVRPPVLSVKIYRPYAGVRLETEGQNALLNAHWGAHPLSRQELYELQRDWQSLQGEPSKAPGWLERMRRMVGRE